MKEIPTRSGPGDYWSTAYDETTQSPDGAPLEPVGTEEAAPQGDSEAQPETPSRLTDFLFETEIN